MIIQRHQLLLLVLLFLYNPSSSFSQAEKADSVIYKGIEFLDAEWGEVLALAELEGKTVFLDAYTNWCRPCKVMEKEIFPRPDVGTLYNDNFLNVRMNMERGIGVKLAEKYQIIAYPTLLFINSDGTVAHRYAGYKDAGGFLQLGREALSEDQSIGTLAERFTEGERSEEFLKKYLNSSIAAGDNMQTTILNAYLDTQEDWNTTEIRQLIFQLTNSAHSPLFNYLIENKAAFIEQFGQSKVENQIQSIVQNFLRASEDPIVAAETLLPRVYPERGVKLANAYKLNHYRESEDGLNYAKAVKEYLAMSPTQEQEDMNEIAWNYYDLVDDKLELKQLLKRVKRTAKSDPSYYNLESLALLYAKYGKTRKAKKITNKAITLAKQANRSAASAEDLMAELNAK